MELPSRRLIRPPRIFLDLTDVQIWFTSPREDWMRLPPLVSPLRPQTTEQSTQTAPSERTTWGTNIKRPELRHRAVQIVSVTQEQSVQYDSNWEAADRREQAIQTQGEEASPDGRSSCPSVARRKQKRTRSVHRRAQSVPHQGSRQVQFIRTKLHLQWQESSGADD